MSIHYPENQSRKFQNYLSSECIIKLEFPERRHFCEAAQKTHVTLPGVGIPNGRANLASVSAISQNLVTISQLKQCFSGILDHCYQSFKRYSQAPTKEISPGQGQVMEAHKSLPRAPCSPKQAPRDTLPSHERSPQVQPVSNHPLLWVQLECAQ